MAVAAAVLDADLAADHIIHRAIRQRVAAGIRVDAVFIDREGQCLLGHHLHQGSIPDGFARGGGQARLIITDGTGIIAAGAA